MLENINVYITSTFIMTKFLLSSAICFDSAMTGFKAKRRKTTVVMEDKVRNSETGGRQVAFKTPPIPPTRELRHFKDKEVLEEKSFTP